MTHNPNCVSCPECDPESHPPGLRRNLEGKRHSEKDQAALDAVYQWQYEPTLLNGDPVEVVTEITVTFRLN